MFHVLNKVVRKLTKRKSSQANFLSNFRALFLYDVIKPHTFELQSASKRKSVSSNLAAVGLLSGSWSIIARIFSAWKEGCLKKYKSTPLLSQIDLKFQTFVLNILLYQYKSIFCTFCNFNIRNLTQVLILICYLKKKLSNFKV